MGVLRNKRKILVFADFLFPEYLGGSARLANELNETLQRSRFDVTCISRRPSGVYSSQLWPERSYRVVYIDQISELMRVLLIDEWDYYIAHHFSLGLLSWLIRPKISGCYFYHGPVRLERKARGGGKGGAAIRHFLEAIALLRASKVFCLSSYMRNQLPTIYLRKSVVTGPLHNKSSQPQPLQKKLNKPLQLLTVRRLTERTGVIELAEMVSKLIGLVQLTVVGGGELLGPLKAKDYSNVHFAGQVDDGALNIFYESADLVILPSRDLEGFGLIIIEAILRNTPVLCSNRAGGGTEFLSRFSDDFVYPIDSPPDRFFECAHRAISTYQRHTIKTQLISAIAEAHMDKFVEKHFQ